MKSCKVYKDGMHFIAMRPTAGISGPRNKPPPEEPIEVIEEQPLLSSDLESDKEAAAQGSETKQSELSSDEEVYDEVCPDLVEIEQPPTKRISTRADEFIRWYRESVGMRREKRREFIATKLHPYFPTEESLYRYIDRKMDTRYRSDIARRIRCLRRAALHELSYFCTFTYDDKKMDEQTFERRLLNTLRHFASRKGWKYMGTWERGGDTNRLHFHAIMYIPNDKMSGEIVQKRDYDVKKRRMVEYTTNTFFEKRFGRNTFDLIDGTALTLNTAIGYIVKYIEKSGGRIICSKGLRTFVETDVDEADIVTPLREYEDKKYILYDDFNVYRDGTKLGAISPSVLARAKTVN